MFKGFVDRVTKAFKVVPTLQVRKYFRSTRRMMELYEKEGATGATINKLAAKKRAHRSAFLAPADRKKSLYDRKRSFKLNQNEQRHMGIYDFGGATSYLCHNNFLVS